MPESGETDHWPADLGQDDELAITEFPAKAKILEAPSHTHLYTFSQRHSSDPDQSQFYELQRPRSRAKAMQGRESHPACTAIDNLDNQPATQQNQI